MSNPSKATPTYPQNSAIGNQCVRLVHEPQKSGEGPKMTFHYHAAIQAVNGTNHYNVDLYLKAISHKSSGPESEQIEDTHHIFELAIGNTIALEGAKVPVPDKVCHIAEPKQNSNIRAISLTNVNLCLTAISPENMKLSVIGDIELRWIVGESDFAIIEDPGKAKD